MEKKIDLGNLFAFYGSLLTPHQQNLMKAYLYEDHSLQEISENYRISRQGVYDSIRRAKTTLMDLESKLGLYALEESLIRLREGLEKIKKDPKDPDLLEALEREILVMEKKLEA